MRTTTKVDDSLHKKMKELAKKNRRSIYDEYTEALNRYVANEKQEEIFKDSKLEKLLDEKLSRIDKHLSSMLGRTGMDTSMILMGLIYFLEFQFKESRETIFEVLKKDGAKYFTNKESKESKNK